MNRVLVTGGAGTIGSAVVRRLLRDPAWEVRVSDRRPAPAWMREGCAVHTGDLRWIDPAREAVAGCTHVIHLAAVGPSGPHTLLDVNGVLTSTVVRAALDHATARFVLVSGGSVFERATEFPTPEDHLGESPPPRDPAAFSRLVAERLVRAAGDEHALPWTIVRPFDPYGAAGNLADLIARARRGDDHLPVPGTGRHLRTPLHVDDVAEGVVAALGSPAALREDLNLGGDQELTALELAEAAWRACGRTERFRGVPTGEPFGPDRSHADTRKARELIGWQPEVGLEEGLRRVLRALGPSVAAQSASRASVTAA